MEKKPTGQLGIEIRPFLFPKCGKGVVHLKVGDHAHLLSQRDARELAERLHLAAAQAQYEAGLVRSLKGAGMDTQSILNIIERTRREIESVHIQEN